MDLLLFFAMRVDRFVIIDTNGQHNQDRRFGSALTCACRLTKPSEMRLFVKARSHYRTSGEPLAGKLFQWHRLQSLFFHILLTVSIKHEGLCQEDVG